MMIERIVFVVLLVVIGAAVYWVVKYHHMRRLKINPAGDRPTLLYFQSDSCSPCTTQAHYLEILEQQYRDRFAMQRIDTEREPEKAAKFGVFTLPTTLVIDRQGDVKYINYGLTNTFRLSQQLESVV